MAIGQRQLGNGNGTMTICVNDDSNDSNGGDGKGDGNGDGGRDGDSNADDAAAFDGKCQLR
jgi:hypothetical protein